MIADMQHWRDALRISFIRTVGSKYLLNKKYLPLPVLLTDKLNTLGWIFVFNLNGSITYLDVSIVVPFILETTGRPGHHAKKFINNLMKDADNPPLAIRDTWSASKAYSTAPSPDNNSQPPLRDPRVAFCHTLSCFSLSSSVCEVSAPSLREHLQRFQFQTCSCLDMWPCCADTAFRRRRAQH